MSAINGDRNKAASTATTALAAQHVHRRIGDLVTKREQLNDDGDQDALQRAERHDAEHGGHG
ncbi:MAG TPA: hypothetical protein VFZ95_01045, partial [Steroidobacteraceae bacterium]